MLSDAPMNKQIENQAKTAQQRKKHFSKRENFNLRLESWGGTFASWGRELPDGVRCSQMLPDAASNKKIKNQAMRLESEGGHFCKLGQRAPRCSQMLPDAPSNNKKSKIKP